MRIPKPAWMVLGGAVLGLLVLAAIAQLQNYRAGQRFIQAVRRPPSAAVPAGGGEQAVIVSLPLSDRGFGTPAERDAIHSLAERLEKAVGDAKAGEFDGDEFGDGKCLLYMYGPDANKLFTAVEPLLRSSTLARGGWVIKRFGPADRPGVHLERVAL